MTNDYLNQLNPQQRAAVEYTDGPQLIIAGAGSGKTRVLTYKIVHLLNKGYLPHQILALTFTNKAAREMRERIESLVGHDVASKLWMGTFHSIFARILRLNATRIGYTANYTIYDANDSASLIKHIIKDMNLDDKEYKPSTIANRISMCKNALITPLRYSEMRELLEQDRRANRPRTVEIYQQYWLRLRHANVMDFDDLLLNTNILLRDCPDVCANYRNFFQYVLIDEYQDTNFSQDMIVYQLASTHQHLSVVGDDAQSIYSFRGANINNILSLKDRYPRLKIFRLEQNYRSTQTITLAANSLIEKNKDQIKKSLFSENAVGEKIKVISCSTDYEEAFVVANTINTLKRRQGSKFSDFAVLYRINALSRILEKALSSGGLRDAHGNTREKIPYRIHGGTSFYQRKEIKDAVCYMRLVLNPNDDEALRRCVKYPPRGIGETTMAKISTCAIENKVSLWKVMENAEFYHLNINKGTATKLKKFTSLINEIIALNTSGATALNVVHGIITKIGLISVLESDNTPENISRRENLYELISGAKEFVEMKQEDEFSDGDVSLQAFLADVALATDQDTNDSDDVVTLMTVHAAKGLEFKNIIIFGADEDIFPSIRVESLADLEEERRLFYVAITRAEQTCTITHAEIHTINGMTISGAPSRFLGDIDPQYLSMSGKKRAASFQNTGRWQADYDTPLWRNNSPQPSAQPATTTQPPKAPQRRPSPPEKVYTIHDTRELNIGKQIMHERFGTGTITDIDNKNKKITVNFDTLGTKTLLLKFAKFQILK